VGALIADNDLAHERLLSRLPPASQHMLLPPLLYQGCEGYAPGKEKGSLGHRQAGSTIAPLGQIGEGSVLCAGPSII